VCCRGTEVGVAKAAEYTEGRVIRELPMEKLVGDGMLYGRGGASVEQKCGGCQGVVRGWHRGVQQQVADGVVDGAKDAFSFTILLRCVRAREDAR
jgi:hypothetical protein